MAHLASLARNDRTSGVTRSTGNNSGFWRGISGALAAVGRLIAFPSPPLRAPRRLGEYTIERKLGEGGMGIVYKAVHERSKRPVAVKVLARGRDGHDLKRFEREVRVMRRLSHPNSVSVYDFGRTHDGDSFYVMEYVDGIDLQTLVERDGPQDPVRVALWLAELAGALAEAHGMGLVHRDVKPANVMLCERSSASDVVKLLDFGLSKEVDAAADLTQTDPGRIIGTPLYLSPEALTDPENLDARADLYALGALGYFLLTGLPPFTGRTLIEVCGHHLHSDPVPPSRRVARSIPGELEAMILKCLAKSPDQRPRSAAALQLALLEFARRAEGPTATEWPAEAA
jgi:serine/threonine-protein kinase